jgi:hypothetical protein
VIVSGCTFSFLSKEKSTKKEKSQPGPVATKCSGGQGKWLPQHYQCCMRRGYVRVVMGLEISISIILFLILFLKSANSFGQKRVEQWWVV